MREHLKDRATRNECERERISFFFFLSKKKTSHANRCVIREMNCCCCGRVQWYGMSILQQHILPSRSVISL